MKILFGSVIEDNAGWGAEWFLKKSFEELEVRTYDVDYKKNRFRLVSEFDRFGSSYFDGFLLQRGDYFPLNVVRALPRPRIFWATELVARRKDQEPNIRSELFDHVYVRSNPCYEKVIRLGWRDPGSLSVMSTAFHPSVFYPIPNQEKDLDVVFVGSKMPRREALLDEVSKTFSVDRARVYGTQMNEYFNRAKIVLNLHSEDHLDTETRVYEALGSGAFLITEPLSSESPFKHNQHLVEAQGAREITEAIDYYLRHSDERKRIATAGQIIARSEHTYLNRAIEIRDRFRALQCVIEGPKQIDQTLLHRDAWREPLRAIGWGLKRTAFRAQRKARHTLKRAAKR
ncbi:MAG: glycosyltransferase [Alkalispirochaeta sp.]